MMTAQLRTELAEIAKMAYGHGFREATKGGEGRIGMIGDRVVKFNTNWWERSSGPKADDKMRASCNALRARLIDIARRAGLEDALPAIRKALGLKGNTDEVNCKKLLDRKVVAKVIGMIAGNQANAVWNKAISMGTERSTGDMHFETVKANAEREIEFADQQRKIADFTAGQVAMERERVTTAAIGRNGASDTALIFNLCQKRGVTFADSQLKAIVRAMNDPNVPFLALEHGECSRELLNALVNGDVKNCDTDIKDTVAVIDRIESAERRADVIALALVAGPRAISGIFRNDSILNDIFALHEREGGVIDTALLKKWADNIITDFEDRFPYAPPIKSGDAVLKFHLDTARDLRLLLMIDEYGKGGMLRNEEPDADINLDGWKNGPDIGQGTVNDRFFANSRCTSLSILGLEFNDEPFVRNWQSVGKGVVLTKEAIPSGYSPLPEEHLPEDVWKQVQGDLKRTRINAKFQMPKGESHTIDTSLKPKDDVATAMANELDAQVRSFLGIEEEDGVKNSLQARMVLGMCCQWSMGFQKPLTGEHAPRQVEFSRDGEDVLVHVQNLKDPSIEYTYEFDYTIRIGPDGKNSFETLDAHPLE